MTDLICDVDGIRLSPGVALAERRGAAIVPRHAHDIFRRLAPEFGVDLDWVRLNGAVGRAARFLTEGRLDAARKAAAVVRLPQRLAKFNPNHYGPGSRGGQFAPAGYGSVAVGADREATRSPADPQVAQEFLFSRPPVIPDDDLPEFKEPIPRLSGKEGSKETPSWARGMRPREGESGRDFAKRLMDEKYGPGNWDKSNPEYKQLQKKGDRSFRDPKSFVPPYGDGA